MRSDDKLNAGGKSNSGGKSNAGIIIMAMIAITAAVIAMWVKPTLAAEAAVAANENAPAPQKFTHFRVGQKNVKTIYLDGPITWVGTTGGIVRYDTRDDTFKRFDNTNGLLSNGVFYLGRLRGRITVGTYGGGLSVLDEKKGTWRNYNIPDGLGDAFVYDAIEVANGDIWIATWSGVNRVRGGALGDPGKWDLFTVANTKGGLPNDWVYGLAEGKNGEIWLATEGGLARFFGGKWDNWNRDKGLGAPYEKVKAAIDFKSDVGTASDHHAKQKLEMGLENVDVAYNPNYVIALEVDREGNVWAGTWGAGLSRFDGKNWVTYTTVEGLPSNHIFMLHYDDKGQLWIGTNKGLAHLKNGKYELLTRTNGLFDDGVFSMAIAPSGAMWIGSYGGLAYLRPAAK